MKDDDLWFKKRKIGWGWTPCSREGWFVIILYIGAILFLGFTFDENASDEEAFFALILPLILLTAILIWVSYKKGEKIDPPWKK